MSLFMSVTFLMQFSVGSKRSNIVGNIIPLGVSIKLGAIHPELQREEIYELLDF